MTLFCVVTTTTDSLEVAETITATLLQKRLAACIQRHSVTSTYRWQGKIVTGKEYLLQIKTRCEHFDAICKTVRELHNYDLPEIVMTPLEGEEHYLDWVRSETSRAFR